MNLPRGVSRSRDGFFSALEDGQFEELVVAFDQTLLLENSTELFLDRAFPRGLAWLLARAGSKTARIFYKDHSLFLKWRDFFRVGFVIVGLPWSYLCWKRNARKVMRLHLNERLYRAVESFPIRRLTIISFGFKQLIAPLLAELSPSLTLVASSLAFPVSNLRLEGKLFELQKRSLSRNRVLAISDSAEDSDLLEGVSAGYLIEWKRLPPRLPAYFPFRFILEGKPAGFFEQIVKQDLVIICLAYFFDLRAFPLLLLLTSAFFVIYEIGYHENDYVAASLESAPVVRPDSGHFRRYSINGPGWAWTVGILMVIGILYSFRVSACWLTLLIVLRAIFYVYNRLQPAARIPLYVGLQLLKYFSYCLVFVPCFLGAILLAAQSMRFMLFYSCYRISGRVPQLNVHLVRLLAFAGLLAVMMAWKLPGFREGSLLQNLLILSWVLYLGITPLLRKMA